MQLRVFFFHCPSLHRWQNPCCHWRQPGLHQRQLHPHASWRWGVLLHLLPGPSAFHSAGFLADDLGEQIWRHCHDDPGSRTGKGEMSQVLAREAGRASGHRQVPASPGQPAVPGVLPHQGHPHGGDRGGWFVRIPTCLMLVLILWFTLNLKIQLEGEQFLNS